MRTCLLVVFAAFALIACEQKSPTPNKPAGTPTPASAPKAAPSAAPKSGDDKATPPAPSDPATANPPAPVSESLTAGSLAFPIPTGWRSEKPANAMRLAQLHVGDASAGAECVATFSQMGGDVESNRDRWIGQVRDAAGKPIKATKETREVRGLKVHLVESLNGTYDDGGMSGAGSKPRTNWSLRGAIVELADGLYFIKMTGPAEAMAAAEPGWRQLIDGMKKK